jgi:hypothetical protein
VCWKYNFVEDFGKNRIEFGGRGFVEDDFLFLAFGGGEPGF